MSTAQAPFAEVLAATAAATPAPIAATFDSAMQQLAASGAAPGLDVGEQAPRFALPDQLGRVARLDEHLQRGPVVLAFYRGDWCPFCNLTLRRLQDELDAIRRHGAELLAISPQAPDRALTLAEKHELRFPVLSDADQATIAAYRLRYELSPTLKDLFEHRFGNDLREQNADGSWHLPVPGTFVIDRDGVIRSRFVDADFRRRMEPAEIVAALAELEHSA